VGDVAELIGDGADAGDGDVASSGAAASLFIVLSICSRGLLIISPCLFTSVDARAIICFFACFLFKSDFIRAKIAIAFHYTFTPSRSSFRCKKKIDFQFDVRKKL